jgi:thiosulfate dehydrogenase
LWGAQSFNVGAGMARVSVAAAFVQAKMPLGNAGSLTDQESIDLASYFTAQPRPDFGAKSKDWPKGGRPADAR